MATDQILQKPPRLLSTEAGAYDWREFDRWIRRVYDMLAIRSDSDSYSLLGEIEAMRSLGYLSSDSTSTGTLDQTPLVYTVGGLSDTTFKEDTASIPSLIYGLGNNNASSKVDDSYLTLYWMGV